jgi:hypothetical protein
MSERAPALRRRVDRGRRRRASAPREREEGLWHVGFRGQGEVVRSL